jgi:hypothetical protein
VKRADPTAAAVAAVEALERALGVRPESAAKDEPLRKADAPLDALEQGLADIARRLARLEGEAP